MLRLQCFLIAGLIVFYGGCGNDDKSASEADAFQQGEAFVEGMNHAVDEARRKASLDAAAKAEAQATLEEDRANSIRTAAEILKIGDSYEAFVDSLGEPDSPLDDAEGYHLANWLASDLGFTVMFKDGKAVRLTKSWDRPAK